MKDATLLLRYWSCAVAGETDSLYPSELHFPLVESYRDITRNCCQRLEHVLMLDVWLQVQQCLGEGQLCCPGNAESRRRGHRYATLASYLSGRSQERKLLLRPGLQCNSTLFLLKHGATKVHLLCYIMLFLDLVLASVSKAQEDGT